MLPQIPLSSKNLGYLIFYKFNLISTKIQIFHFTSTNSTLFQKFQSFLFLLLCFRKHYLIFTNFILFPEKFIFIPNLTFNFHKFHYVPKIQVIFYFIFKKHYFIIYKLRLISTKILFYFHKIHFAPKILQYFTITDRDVSLTQRLHYQPIDIIITASKISPSVWWKEFQIISENFTDTSHNILGDYPLGYPELTLCFENYYIHFIYGSTFTIFTKFVYESSICVSFLRANIIISTIYNNLCDTFQINLNKLFGEHTLSCLCTV